MVFKQITPYRVVIGLIIFFCFLLYNTINKPEKQRNVKTVNCIIVDKEITGTDTIFYNLFVKCGTTHHRVRVSPDNYFNASVNQSIDMSLD